MKSWFLKRGYPNDVIQKEMEKIKISKILSTRKHNTKGVQMVVTYHPSLKNIDQVINRNSHLLHMGQEFMRIFTAKPRFSFRRGKLYPLERKVGSFNVKG